MLIPKKIEFKARINQRLLGLHASRLRRVHFHGLRASCLRRAPTLSAELTRRAVSTFRTN